MAVKLLFATNNKHKVEEVQKLLGDDYQLVTPADMGLLEDIPETQPTLEGNALQKAHYVFEKLGLPCFADDTGLEVDALGGAPGVYSARYAGSDKDPERNIDKLLGKLKNALNDQRGAQFRCVIALVDGKNELLFEGIVKGKILQNRVGAKGFGYDSVFSPDGFSCSFAEMSMVDKNRISHRGQATIKLINYLKNNKLTNKNNF